MFLGVLFRPKAPSSDEKSNPFPRSSSATHSALIDAASSFAGPVAFLASSVFTTNTRHVICEATVNASLQGSCVSRGTFARPSVSRMIGVRSSTNCFASCNAWASGVRPPGKYSNAARTSTSGVAHQRPSSTAFADTQGPRQPALVRCRELRLFLRSHSSLVNIQGNFGITAFGPSTAATREAIRMVCPAAGRHFPLGRPRAQYVAYT
jgi:hypothetical protein